TPSPYSARPSETGPSRSPPCPGGGDDARGARFAPGTSEKETFMHAALRRFASFVLLVLVGAALLASCGPKEPSDESTNTLRNYGNADSATMNSSTRAMMDSIAHADSMHSLAVSNGMAQNS